MKKTIFTIILALNGCAFINLQKNLNEMENSIVLSGKITTPAMNHNIVVLVYRSGIQGKEIVDYKRIDATGYYIFVVPSGEKYFLTAFADDNENLVYDEGEAVGNYGNPSGVSTSTEDSGKSLDFGLFPRSHYPHGLPARLEEASVAGNKNIPFISGEITNLQDDRFSRRKAKFALWTPLDFAKRNGIGVFFLEEYDPAKVPILFVHGAGGTPGDWGPIIENLDRSCYQPWLFYYPTGVRLSQSTELLSGVMEYLHKQYKFEHLVVVAHSIGGLIVRAAIANALENGGNNYVDMLVSISTPWNGHNAAKHGVENAPAVVPLWIDLQPNSAFIRSLYESPLKDNIDFYLLFSFYNNSVFDVANDGTVTVASQLDYRAQDEAKRLIGIDASHTEVLKDKKTFSVFNDLITAHTQEKHPALYKSCVASR